MRPMDDEAAVDPALAPLIEAGQGESEGFELSEEALVRHASHGDDEQTTRILLDADDRDEEDAETVYGEADEEHHPDA